ncbi:sodium:solute symporter family protein [Fusobacterium sp. PH5-44]|uniref:sodium:solute symporter family protein n=1 Tax=unclassified Fusobacterium TaxID=2648384 RepID=UPI003D243307
MNIQLTFGIYCIIFCALMIGAGIYSKKWVSDASDFIIAGRELSFPINTMGVAAIGFAGTTVSLACGFSVLYGVKGALSWGIIYSIFGLVVYGLVFSNFVRRCGAQTLPEYFEMRYSGKVRNLVAYGTIIGMCGILANNVVSLSAIVSGYVGWPTYFVMGASFLVIMIFATLSGVWASSITDFIQVVIGTIAIPLLLILLMKKFGGIEFVENNWLTGNFMDNGISGGTLPGMSLKYPSVLNFFLCFSSALVWGNNYYWGKIASSRNEKIAKKSFVTAGIALMIIFMIPLALIGAYTGAATPESFTIGGGTIAPTAAYGVAAKMFSPLISSFIVIGCVAASISTSSTSAMGATSTATRDIYMRTINPTANAAKSLKASKIIMILVLSFTWILCYFPGGPTYLFAFSNCWLVPPAILLCLGAIWPKFNSKGAFLGVVCGMIVMVIFTILDLTKIFSIGQFIYLAILGFLVTAVVGIVVTILSPRDSKYYGQDNWEIIPNNNNREKIVLDEFDMNVLSLIRVGHKYMADITDGLKVDSKISTESIEKLDRGGYIRRLGKTGSNFYTFELCERGYEVLPKLNDIANEMEKDYLNNHYLEFLKAINISSKELSAEIKRKNYTSLQVSSIVSHLFRRGYILENGLYKRRLSLTSTGEKIIKKYS